MASGAGMVVLLRCVPDATLVLAVLVSLAAAFLPYAAGRGNHKPECIACCSPSCNATVLEAPEQLLPVPLEPVDVSILALSAVLMSTNDHFERLIPVDG